MTNYKMIIRKEAAKKLKSLGVVERLRITDKLVELALNPDGPLDVKRLIGTSLWRLRIGGWRVLFWRDDCLKILSIERIKSRGDVYK